MIFSGKFIRNLYYYILFNSFRYICYCFTKNTQVYEEVASYLMNMGYFKEAAATDIVAALGLVRQLQIIKTDFGNDPLTHVEYDDGKTKMEFDVPSVPRFDPNMEMTGLTLEELRDMADVCRYACCVYGWLLYSYKKWDNIFEITCGRRGCCCTKVPNNVIDHSYATCGLYDVYLYL